VNTFKLGDRFQHYVVESLIGSGFHGQVYAIRHLHTGARFALKVIHLASQGDARRVARALVEAKGTYSIQHKNVVEVFDLSCEPNGMVWMRTELLRGHTIDGLLAIQGRLSVIWALSAAIEAAWGLHAAHERQIIHRDVKPANLFHAEPGTIKVIDFSIAKVFPEGLDTTAGRAGMGTPAYMAPEQLEGARPDVRFDVYGLGITAYQMIAGKNPWSDVLDNTAELIRRQMHVMPPLLSDLMRLPRRVDEVLGRAIAKDPSQRYASIMEMGRVLCELRAWLLDEAQAGRLVLRKRMGEPPCPGDPDADRAYRAPGRTPVHPLPAPSPSARVLVPEPRVEAARSSDTAGMTAARMPGDLAGTVPLEDVSRTGRGTELLPAAPTARTPSAAASRPALVPASALPAAEASPRETPATSARPVAESSPTRRRISWGVVAVTVVLAATASLAGVWWLVAARGAPEPHAPTAPPRPTTSASSPASTASPPASASAPRRTPASPRGKPR